MNANTPAATPATPHGCTNFKLRRVARMASRHYDAHLAASGLKTTQYSLLMQAARLGPVRPVDLAHAMGLDASTLTRNLRPMVQAGLLDQGEGPDARSRLITLTEAGRVKRAAAQRLWRTAQVSLNGMLGVERVAALHALLDESVQLLQDAGLQEVSEEAAHG